jgi:hypothetical protein
LSALLQKEASLQKALGLYYTTKLKPETIVFDAKSSLKHKEAVVISFGRYFAFTAAAASVALLIWMGVADRTQPASMAGNWKKEIIETPAGQTSTDSVAPTQNSTPNDHSTTPQVVRPSLPSNNDTPNDLAHDVVVPTPENKAPEHKTIEYSPDPIAYHTAHPFANPLEVPQMSSDMALIFEKKNSNAPASSATNEYMTVWQFAENEAKTKLWGSTDYPKDGFALALAQRGVSQIADKYESAYFVLKSFMVFARPINPKLRMAFAAISIRSVKVLRSSSFQFPKT